MARISTYPLDTKLVGSDYWIGSDANSSFATKNFTIESVAKFMNREAVQSQAIRFVYTNTVPVGTGMLAITNLHIYFSSSNKNFRIISIRRNKRERFILYIE